MMAATASGRRRPGPRAAARRQASPPASCRVGPRRRGRRAAWPARSCAARRPDRTGNRGGRWSWSSRFMVTRSPDHPSSACSSLPWMPPNPPLDIRTTRSPGAMPRATTVVDDVVDRRARTRADWPRSQVGARAATDSRSSSGRARAEHRRDDHFVGAGERPGEVVLEDPPARRSRRGSNTAQMRACRVRRAGAPASVSATAVGWCAKSSNTVTPPAVANHLEPALARPRNAASPSRERRRVDARRRRRRRSPPARCARCARRAAAASKPPKDRRRRAHA